MTDMSEEAIAAALEGKFFRGPSTFYQQHIYHCDEVEEYRPVRPPRATIAERREQVEREAELSPTKWRIPISMCIDAVAEAHRIDVKAMRDVEKTGSRRASMVACRQHAAWLIKKLRPDVTTTQIAQRLNYKDHSTVIYAVRRFDSTKSTYVPEIEAALALLRERTGDETICLL